MIGVFDSGSGGIAALKELRRLRKSENVVFLADRDHAPYGTRSRESILALAKENVTRLRRLGARRVLIACCTASTVHADLPREVREISVPIIEPTASFAREHSATGRIAVIATEATVRSHAFARALAGCRVTELAAQRLVGEVEGGAHDGNITPKLCAYLDELLLPAVRFGADVLILGCTHFPHLEGEIRRALSRLTNRKILTVSSALCGALAMDAALGDECPEGGATVYL